MFDITRLCVYSIPTRVLGARVGLLGGQPLLTKKTVVSLAATLLFASCVSAQERSIETCSDGEPTTGKGLPDKDADGIADAVDNCIDQPNPAQVDSNADGFGNACDADLNNDNIVNVLDLSLLRAAFFEDSPLSDADFDGDGDVAISDLAVMRRLFFKPPGPIGPCLADEALCRGPMYFEASDQSDNPQANLFVLKTTDPGSIYHAKRLLDGSSQCNQAIAGYTFLGTQDWNTDWGFYIDGDVYFHGDSLNAPTGCNRTAGFVEANLGMWCNIDTRATQCRFWCPWTSGLTRIVPVVESPLD